MFFYWMVNQNTMRPCEVKQENWSIDSNSKVDITRSLLRADIHLRTLDQNNLLAGVNLSWLEGHRAVRVVHDHGLHVGVRVRTQLEVLHRT